MTKEQLVLLTVKELKAMAKENGLKGYSKLRKAELVELLAVEVTEAEVEATKKESFFNYDTIVKVWHLKREKNIIKNKEYDLVLYCNNRWHTIINSNEIDISSLLSTINLELQDEQLVIIIKGFELLDKPILSKVNSKLLKSLEPTLKKYLGIKKEFKKLSQKC